MAIITSKDNPALKLARKLKSRKGRERVGAFLVEGHKLISEAKAAGYTVEFVFLNAGAQNHPVFSEYPGGLMLEEKLFFGLAGTVTPQPVIATVRHKDADDGLLRDARDEGIEFDEALFHRHAPGHEGEPAIRVLILDRIGDPGNVGTMVRSALAAGMSAVWCVKGTADVFSDKSIRASAGAVFHIPVREGLSVNDCLGYVLDLETKLIACSAGGEDLFGTDLSGSLALVVGNEGAGVDEAFSEAADTVVGIPMNEAAESLNAATAAAIVMYEALRQRL